MGIQLPPELSAVAAQAGVTWPEADEDRMRQAAAAWRDAGTELTTLTRDADNTVRNALNAVDGDTGDAARWHWSTFVQPDTGHLTATAHGCTAAADRLDHAANQVGAAKVEIIRNLVALARNTDAAEVAANAGHPQALLGLDTAVRGTAANVTNITNNLATAVQPATGVDMSGVRDLVNANPGTQAPSDTGGGHRPGLLERVVGGPTDVVGGVAGGSGYGDAGGGHRPGLLDPVVATADSTVRGLTDAVGGAGQAVVGDAAGGSGHGDAGGPRSGGLGSVVGAVDGTVRGVTDVVGGAGQGVSNVVGGASDVVGSGLFGPGHGGDSGLPAVGSPDVTGPVRILPGDAGLSAVPDLLRPDLPTPPSGIPAGPGQTVQAGFAGAPVLDAAAPAQAPPGQAAAPGPVPPAGGPAPAAPVGGPAPGIPAAPGGPMPGVPAGGGAGAAPSPVAGTAPPPSGSTDARADRQRGAMTTAVPPGPPASSQPAAQPLPKVRRDGPEILFWVHMFPFGHMPVVSDRPARQLPPPPVEVDYAPGMRFDPGDHPEHHRVDGSWRLDELRAGVPPLRPADGLPAEHPAVAGLAEGHDPLGGEHERDWDRRYLVRLGSVTAQGISDEGKEFAWPPGEVYPEGGTAPGEPEMLAEGTVIDRFGSPHGRVFSAADTPFPRRSLPPELLGAGYNRYRVTRPIPVWRTVSAPWFAQPGGGERYRTTYSALELLALGYLSDITGGAA